MNSTMRNVLILVVSCCVAAAQTSKGPLRSTAELKVDKNRLALEYEVVAASDGPEHLAVGSTWSPGSTPAVLTLEAPLRGGSVLVAPGRYRVRLARTGDAAWALRVENAPRELGPGKVTGGDLDLPMTRGALTPPADRLEAKWALGKPKNGGTALTLTLRIGDSSFVLNGTSWPSTERSTQGWTSHAWALPADFIASLSASGMPTPYVTLTHADAADPKRLRTFNVLVCGDDIGVTNASEGPGPDGNTPTTRQPQMYASGSWTPSKTKAPMTGAPLVDMRPPLGFYMKLVDGARSITFSVHEPDYGQKKK